MTPDWNRIRELFDRVVSAPPDHRDERLAEECRDDPFLLTELRSLLDAHDQELLAAGRIDPVAEAPARRFGPYETERLLGRGGMGTVWLARRVDGQFTQRVAVKVVGSAVGSPILEERFRMEREILAGLDHPHIARLLDGGVAEAGELYLVMEYIEGVDLADYCRERRLPFADRLRLFCDVCAAVAYAHQNLVVHRDIKPANILVTAEGSPKVLDFGAAKLLRDREDTGATTFLAMTPRFASPERLRGLPATTLTDVYSLGVTLYFVLTGSHPFGDAAESMFEIEREVLEKEPPLASAVVKLDAAVRRQLRGDIDNILRKAMQKEPARRYASVADFAADVRRYLAGEPVQARPATLGYRAGKFVRRHAVAVAAGIVVAVALTATAGVALYQARVARVEAEKARKVNQFINNILISAAPAWYNSRGSQARSLTVLDLLDTAGEQATKDLGGQPAVEAELRRTLGRAYTALGAAPKARDQLTEALRKSIDSGAPESEIVATKLYLAQGTLYGGGFAEAEKLLREVLDYCRRSRGPVDPEVYMMAANDLAVALGTQGSYSAETESLLREAYNLSRARNLNPRGASVNLANLGVVMLRRGDLTGAGATLREAIAQQRAFSPPPVEIFSALRGLAILNRHLGNIEEAEQQAREARATAIERLGNGHVNTLRTRLTWASLAAQTGLHADAEKEVRECMELFRKLRPDGHPELGYPKIALGQVLTFAGRAAEGEPHLREALSIFSGLKVRDEALIAELAGDLGACLRAQGRRHDAEAMFQQSAGAYAKLYGAAHELTKRARARIYQ